MEFNLRFILFLCNWYSYIGAYLPVGLVLLPDSEEFNRLLVVQRDTYGWFSEVDYGGRQTDTDKSGVCVAAYPSSALNGSHFTDQQVFAEIDGLFCKTSK